MTTALRSPFTLAWGALVAATAASYAIAEDVQPGILATTLVMLIAAVKVRWIFLHFMELKNATGNWRWVFEAWTLLVLALTLGWYLLEAR